MRFTSSILALAACLSAVACASSEPAGGSSASAALELTAKNEPDKVICTREHVVGSHRPEKVCLTARQRLELAERSKDQLERLRVRGAPGEKPAGM